MPHYTTDRCSVCGLLASKELLTIKRVNFMKRLTPSKTLKSRTVAWLCEKCLSNDPEWNTKRYSGPGHTSEALERVRDTKNDPT